ncbi:hypothetical protein C1645_817815 [Glomus cerebriforme]|uniref:Uncharacterized protein n=1 Tax=Glomus cerebriforme TaxID=658196 RepID=A0A397T9L8_9GLOM|nr:hypothetical protein C1645_817815 [Glomus cerebriforme]
MNRSLAFFCYNRASEIIYSALPIEYSKTSPQEVATIFIFQVGQIQWHALVINGTGGSISVQNCPFLGIPVKKNVRKCQGIKHCSFADPEFIKKQHNEVDMKSETFIKLNQHQNNTKTKTYIFFLAVQSTACKYNSSNAPCNGRAKLRKLVKNAGQVEEYFIGCDKWVKGQKWHCYIKIDDEIQCCTLVPRASRIKYCAVRGDIIERKCNVQFIKFIPYDLVACPYIALVCIGTHDHPPPPPERTPAGLKDELQTMIQNIISSDNNVTPGSIVAGNYIKATFDKDTLFEVHASLNNIDKLRSLVAKCYKNTHPYGQGNLGVLYSQ